MALTLGALAILFGVVLTTYGSPLQPTPHRYISSHNVLGTINKRLDEATTEFKNQFRSPAAVLAVLLIIGGDIVQKAIAQLSGGWITPVSFSFGWVSYAFAALLSAFGDGIFLPHPDLTTKIITVGSAGSKTNESWIIARLIRDLELEAEKEYRKEPWRLQTSLMVSVYDSLPDVNHDTEVEKDEQLPPKDIPKDWVWYSYFLVCAIQLGIAAVPLYDSPEHRQNWSILFITGCGIALALWTGSSWQFRKEKFACRRNSTQDYLLTRGNGHKHVFLIRHRKAHNTRWPRGEEKEYLGASLSLEDLANVGTRRASWRSRTITVLNALLWIFYLVTVGGQIFDTWYLFAVGSIGMGHNIMTASIRRDPAAHGFHMKRTRQTAEQNSVFGQPPNNNAPRPKVMKGLWQLEQAYPGAGIALLHEFFPGGLREGSGTAVGDEGTPAGGKKSEKEQWDTLKKSLKQRRDTPERKRGENRAAPISQADIPITTPLHNVILFLLLRESLFGTQQQIQQAPLQTPQPPQQPPLQPEDKALDALPVPDLD